MLIKVTQEDIDKGIRYRSALCPVALACEKAFGYTCSVGNNELTIFINRDDPESWERKVTPNEVYYFIKRFDHQLGVEPFEFEI